MSTLEASRVVPLPAQRVPRQAWRNGSTLMGERTLGLILVGIARDDGFEVFTYPERITRYW
jgi:hypothetical protein